MLLSSSSSRRQNVFKMEVQQEEDKGTNWGKLAQEARNQYLEKMSLINYLDPYEIPDKKWTSDPC